MSQQRLRSSAEIFHRKGPSILSQILEPDGKTEASAKVFRKRWRQDFIEFFPRLNLKGVVECDFRNAEKAVSGDGMMFPVPGQPVDN